MKALTVGSGCDDETDHAPAKEEPAAAVAATPVELRAAGAVVPEGKAREGEEEDSPPPQRGAEPKKTTPKAKYTGKVSALYNLCTSRSKPDMNEFNALIQAGIDIRWKVRRN